MAREVLTFAGAAIGFYFGGPAGAAFGSQIGGMVGGMVDPPDPIEGPRLTDLQVTASTYGTPIPLIYGPDNRVAGNVIWSTGLKEKKKTTRSGGKGGGGQSVTEYEYHMSLAVSLGQGPVDGIRKVWANSKLMFDIDELEEDPPPPTPEVGMVVVTGTGKGGGLLDKAAQAGGPYRVMRFYQGNGTQQIDPTIESHEGVGNTPAYRHTSYLVIENLQLADYGNQMPNIEVEVSGQGGTFLVEVVEEFTTVGPHEWTPPDNILNNQVDVLIVGGGGSTSGGNIAASGYLKSGGGGGGSVRVLGFDAPAYVVTPGEPIDIFVGRGGGTGESSNGEASSFADVVMPGGGQGGFGGNSSSSRPGRSGSSGGGGAAGRDDGAWLIQSPGPGTAPYGFDGGEAVPEAAGGGGGSGWWSEVDESGGFIALQDGTGNLAGGGHGGSGRGPGTLPDWIGEAGYSGFGGGGGGNTLAPMTPGGVGGGGNAEGPGGSEQPIAAANSGGGGGSFLHNISGGSGGRGRGGSGVVLVHYFVEHSWSSNDQITVGAVARDICRRAGIENVSTSGLDMPLRGYVVAQSGPAFQALEPLARAYNFDVTEQGGQIRCVLRGRGMRGVIPIGHMGATEGADGQRPEPIRYETATDLQMPQEVSVTYLDPDMDYQVNTQRAARIEGSSRNNIRREIPVTLTADEARALADRELWEAWAGRRSARFNVSDLWVRRNPADVLGIPIAGAIAPHRLIRMTRGNGGVIEIEAQFDDPEVYGSTAAGAPPNIPQNPIRLPGLTRLVMMDMPIVRAVDDDDGFYWAVSADQLGWRGAQILRSSDGGANYDIMSPVAVRTTMGDVASALPAGPSVIWDRGNVITVELHYEESELESVSELAVLNGANAAWLGPADGQGGEIIQFATATLVSDSTYELRDLLRGRLGTEHAIGTHGADEVLVMLEPDSMGRSDFGAGDWDRERLYKPVSNLTSALDTSEQEFTNTGVGKKPLSPVHIEGERDIANDLTITWIRRTRLRVPGFGHGPVPLGEETEAYEIDILAGSPATVVRTLAATSPSVAYTAAQQTADGITPGDPVTVTVYQISGARGRGYGATRTV